MSAITPAMIRDAGAQWLAGDLGNLLGILKRGWRLIAISLVVCLTLAVIYLAATKRMYLATARLLVLQQSGRPLNVSNTDTSRLVEGMDDYLPTHAGVIRSPLIVSRAIESIGMRNLPTLLQAQERGDSPVDTAIENLNVSRPDRTAKILRVNYIAGSKIEATRMVEAVTESYKTFLEENYRQNNNRVVPLISKARDELKSELEEMQEMYLQFRKQTPVLTADENGRSYISRRIDQWDRISTETQVKMMLLKAQLELGRKLAGEGTGMWAVAHAMSQVGGESGGLVSQVGGAANFMSSDYVRQLSQQQQELAERYGPQYSKVQELQDQIARIQERMRESKSRIDQNETRDLLRATEESLKAVEVMRANIVKQFDEDLAHAKDIEIDLLTDSNLRGNLERQRALFNTVVDQLKQAQLSSDFSSVSAQTIEPANALPRAVKPKVMMTLFLAVLGGSMMGMALTVVADRLDTRITSIDELRSILNFNLLGVVPQLPKGHDVTVAPVGLISHVMPRSPSAEAYKSIRTNLELLRRNSRVQVILVTSPHSSDGKSSTASNLAISLAHAGRKVLLVDADLRRPSQDRVHNIHDNRGLSHILRDLLPLERVVQDSEVENLGIIAAGPEAPNPAELLSSNRLVEFIEEARQVYHTVIIDSPPLLAVADPAIIGSLVDGVILVVRDAVTKRYDAERTAELLNTLGTPILGIVVNGVTLDRGGYGYGHGYGYGAGEGAYGRNGRARSSDEASSGGGAPHSHGTPEMHAAGQPGVNGSGPEPT